MLTLCIKLLYWQCYVYWIYHTTYIWTMVVSCVRKWTCEHIYWWYFPHLWPIHVWRSSVHNARFLTGDLSSESAMLCLPSYRVAVAFIGNFCHFFSRREIIINGKWAGSWQWLITKGMTIAVVLASVGLLLWRRRKINLLRLELRSHMGNSLKLGRYVTI